MEIWNHEIAQYAVSEASRRHVTDSHEYRQECNVVGPHLRSITERMEMNSEHNRSKYKYVYGLTQLHVERYELKKYSSIPALYIRIGKSEQ